MKIGIMTIWYSDENYGALLQCFALQKYLRDRGHEAFLIRYKPDSNISVFKKILLSYKMFNPVRVVNFVRKKLERHKLKAYDMPDRCFAMFRDTYLKQTDIIYTTYAELKEHPPEADIYIVGSDQVWNFYNQPLFLCKDHIHAVFLDFGPQDIKRMSYAASWDKHYVLDKHLNEIRPLLQNFSYVSVREEAGLELCDACGVYNAEYVCDPTLLLSVQDYRLVYQENKTRFSFDKYVILYMVLNNYSFNLERVYEWAKQKGLEVIYVTGTKVTNSYTQAYPTVPEWLSLIDNADYVVTNSFHGSLFALLFQKQLGIIPLDGYAEFTNSRFTSLFEYFSVPNRFITNYDFSVLDVPYISSMRIPPNKFLDMLDE